MKEQLIYSIEEQLKEAHQHEYIHVSQDYDEELDEAYDEWHLVAKQTNGICTEVFLWEEGEARFQQWKSDRNNNTIRYNEYDFESVEAFAKWWAVFAYSITR